MTTLAMGLKFSTLVHDSIAVKIWIIMFQWKFFLQFASTIDIVVQDVYCWQLLATVVEAKCGHWEGEMVKEGGEEVSMALGNYQAIFFKQTSLANQKGHLS